MPLAKKSSSVKSPTQKASAKPSSSGPEQKKLLLEWQASVRPYKKLDREVFSTILAAAFLIGVILFFIDGAMPVIALASVIFLFYVMGTVPPHQVKHTLTNWGIESEEKSWPWISMLRYWIKGKKPNRMLNIQLDTNWPQHIRFMLGDVDEKKLVTILQQYLIEDQPKPNWLDKSSVWLENKIRLSPDEK